MCLHSIMPEKRQDTILNKIGEKGLTVYKIVQVNLSPIGKLKYSPPYMNYGNAEYHPGENVVTTKISLWIKSGNYIAGFHFFKTKKAADGFKVLLDTAYGNSIFKVVQCIVKKEWITVIGIELSRKTIESGLSRKIVIVAEKAIFPQFR